MAGMQVRLTTRVTSEVYVTGKLWLYATLAVCPWHSQGGCGFARHGTYTRVKPANTCVARWYCPKQGRTVSALPDCLASHRSGTLDECEAFVRALEQAPSIESACDQLRNDIELPGAIRYVTRLRLAVHGALRAIKGLCPTQFTCQPTVIDFGSLIVSSQVLMSLRQIVAVHLPNLPTPLGFNPPLTSVRTHPTRNQHTMGRDPPQAFIESPEQPPSGGFHFNGAPIDDEHRPIELD